MQALEIYSSRITPPFKMWETPGRWKSRLAQVQAKGRKKEKTAQQKKKKKDVSTDLMMLQATLQGNTCRSQKNEIIYLVIQTSSQRNPTTASRPTGGDRLRETNKLMRRYNRGGGTQTLFPNPNPNPTLTSPGRQKEGHTHFAWVAHTHASTIASTIAEGNVAGRLGGGGPAIRRLSM
ncbi:unnamed protein product [Ectocarpus sp. 4 AP-2014]